ncbi:MAG: hypothetical protein QOJ51_6607 [Acidobacteriaceae bacterium]|nr:hypothetical protein [Acidobacteriaceae bacterium]
MGLDETCYETQCPDTALRSSPAGLMTAYQSEQHKALSSGPIIAKVIVEDLLLELSADPGRSGNIPCLPGEPGRTTRQSVSYGLVLITCN